MSTAPRRPFFRRRKTCPFSGPNAPKIDYKDTRLLSRYISERGKIVGCWTVPGGAREWR
jgi:small subunit ribosomal protein S18